MTLQKWLMSRNIISGLYLVIIWKSLVLYSCSDMDFILYTHT